MNDNVFKTKDLGLGGYLYTEGMVLANCELIGNEVFFHFKDKELCEKMEKEYKFNGAKVEARKYNDALKSLKNEIYQLKGNKYQKKG